MSQRIKRAIERKQSTGFVSIATGGFVAQHSRDNDPHVRVPQKATGDIKPEAEMPQGLAKASPKFKKLEDLLPKTKIDEAKAIAEASIKLEKEEEKKEEEAEDA